MERLNTFPDKNRGSLSFLVLSLLLLVGVTFSFYLDLKAQYLALLALTLFTLKVTVSYVSRGRWDSLFVILIVTYGLYGLSAPISVIFFDLNFPRYEFNKNILGQFGVVYGVGIASILITGVASHFIAGKNDYTPAAAADIKESKLKTIIEQTPALSYIIASLATTSYLLSTISAGILTSFVVSKGYFAAIQGDQYFSFFTTPLVAISIFCFFCRRRATGRGSLALLVLFISPILLIYILNGERSGLLGIAVVFALSISQYSFQLFNKKVILLAFLLVMLLNTIYSTRGWMPSYLAGMGPWKGVQSEYFFRNLNPANSEFHTGSGNFTTFISDPEAFEQPAIVGIGVSYLTAPINIFPRWGLPFEKPTELSIIFNQAYHPDLESQNIRVGFSSWVEGYSNGGHVGVFMHFIVCFSLALILDRLRFTRSSIFYKFLPIGLAALSIKFHRTSLATIFGYTFETIVVWVFVCWVLLALNFTTIRDR